MVKKVLIGAGIAAAVLVVIFVRAFTYQSVEYKKAEKAFEAKNFKTAIVHYETAIHMYTPASPYVDTSVKRMLFIAADFENKKEFQWALNTYESLRSSLYAVQSFYIPYPDVIATCDKKIQELVPKLPK